eukprot:2543373-Amphidinium_carterae.1
MQLTWTDTPGGRRSLLLHMVGTVLFLLHLVPGMPIFASAVLLVAQGGADTLWRDLAIAVVLGMVIKLLAVALQQKLIGYPYSECATIKKLIGVQPSVMKAAKQVLTRHGLGVDKVCVLVSGPDWPASVFTSVLNLPLIQMLISTAPMFFLILPVAVSGALMARVATTVEENDQYPFAATSQRVQPLSCRLQVELSSLCACMCSQRSSRRRSLLGTQWGVGYGPAGRGGFLGHGYCIGHRIGSTGPSRRVGCS